MSNKTHEITPSSHTITLRIDNTTKKEFLNVKILDLPLLYSSLKGKLAEFSFDADSIESQFDYSLPSVQGLDISIENLNAIGYPIKRPNTQNTLHKNHYYSKFLTYLLSVKTERLEYIHCQSSNEQQKTIKLTQGTNEFIDRGINKNEFILDIDPNSSVAVLTFKPFSNLYNTLDSQNISIEDSLYIEKILPNTVIYLMISCHYDFDNHPLSNPFRLIGYKKF